jgi:hypothetical protein
MSPASDQRCFGRPPARCPSAGARPARHRVQPPPTDDINGGQADETITFGLDGTSYELEPSSKNATALRDAVGK